MTAFPDLPDNSYVRVWDIIAPNGPLPMGKSAFWVRVADGRLPKPYKLSSSISMWKVGELRAAFASFKKEA